jgi:hypothetical protein
MDRGGLAVETIHHVSVEHKDLTGEALVRKIEEGSQTWDRSATAARRE